MLICFQYQEKTKTINPCHTEFWQKENMYPSLGMRCWQRATDPPAPTLNKFMTDPPHKTLKMTTEQMDTIYPYDAL